MQFGAYFEAKLDKISWPYVHISISIKSMYFMFYHEHGQNMEGISTYAILPWSNIGEDILPLHAIPQDLRLCPEMI